MMLNKKDDFEKVLMLKPGQSTCVAWSEDGGGIVRVTEDMYVLYEVQQYGGEEQFVGHYDSIIDVLNVAHSWT